MVGIAQCVCNVFSSEINSTELEARNPLTPLRRHGTHFQPSSTQAGLVWGPLVPPSSGGPVLQKLLGQEYVGAKAN